MYNVQCIKVQITFGEAVLQSNHEYPKKMEDDMNK